MKEAAERLGCSAGNLRAVVCRAAKTGQIDLDEPYERLEYSVIPKAVENLEALLAEGDKTATLETVKGTIFKQWAERKGVGEAQQTVLALRFEGPEPGQAVVAVGRVVGKPKGLMEDE